MVKEKTWDSVKDHRRMDNSSDPDTDTEVSYHTPTNGANGNGRGHGHDSDDDHVPNQVEGKGRGKGRPKKKAGKKGKGESKKGVKSSPKKEKDPSPVKSKAKKTTAKKMLTGRVPERKSSRQPIPVQKAETEVEEDFEVSKILKVRTTSDGKREFYVSWKRYPLSQSTWEPEEHLNCKELVKEFLANQKTGKSKSSTGKKRHSSAGSSSGGKKAKVDEDDEDDDEEYEVEKIVSVRFTKGGKKEFEVKWKNYNDTTWEPEENLECADLLMEFAAKVSDLKVKPGSTSSGTKSRSGSGSSKGPKSKSPAKSMSDQSEDDGEDEEYEVSKILDVKTKNGKREFHVQWKGYDRGESTWEPEANLECKDLLKEFLAKKNPPTTGGDGKKGKKRPAGPSSSSGSGRGRPKKAKETNKKIKIQMVKPKRATPPKEDEEEDDDKKEEESESEAEIEDYEVEKILAVRYSKKTTGSSELNGRIGMSLSLLGSLKQIWRVRICLKNSCKMIL